MSKELKAKELRRLLNKLLKEYTAEMDESEMMEYADIYPTYEVNHAYAIGEVFSYDVNADSEPQLYQVLQDHTSAEEWKPDTSTSLYKAVGVTESGVLIWTQPLGASDAYQTGDRVSYNGTIYVSLIDNNTWSPEAYPAGWQVEA